MRSRLKALLAGLLLGVATTLLVVHFTDDDKDQNTAERLEAALHCDDGPSNQTAAGASRIGRYSKWAATNAIRLYGVGCDAGPATIVLEFSPYVYRSSVERALKTMRGFGPVCVVGDSFFDGRLLKPLSLRDLCSEVGGEVRIA